eukprot:13375269-Ditylum_brightwellii.AAC.2
METKQHIFPKTPIKSNINIYSFNLLSTMQCNLPIDIMASMVQGRNVGSVGRIIFFYVLEISLDLLSSVKETVTKDPAVKLDMGGERGATSAFLPSFCCWQ